MDKPTLDYYALHASEVAQRYEVAPSPLAHKFAESFPSGGRILDIGCGVRRQRV